ncbi:hypothetical protein [Pseudobacteriovorax antillogorgiicola]|uniref:Outer membrane protein beta-barrel domain-containing protein n=1 Tax=Pseudobacteriovorax antillogorgiicola TaxID=1513793 RepID=A0A1Y6CNW6_9BACT|nr:hypothetical protein [Pseudobacteriovorax antillogorgiicola]TCS46992.1 hypothetical protein EDD56_12287 [Pseudobacteriovorax antillogorgiicola]SMF64894.1 hypothetical protein SAMN06296036_12287 [Pseudobacteriovorax antillogorgiicola]
MWKVLAFLGLMLPAVASAKKSKSYVNGYFGYGQGGIAIGADYEMKWDKVAGWGGYLLSYGSSDTGPGGLAVGGFLRPHIRKKGYDLHLTAGFGLLNYETQAESSTALGPLIGFGCTKKITKDIYIGLDSMHHYGWFSEPTGILINSGLLTVRYRL